jgi:hypothetical protein
MKKTLYPLFILLLLCSLYNPCTAAKGDLKFKKTTDNSGSAVLLEMRLYRIYSNKSVAVDGTITQYGDEYSDKIDRYDARKMSIPGENISLFRHDTDLVVERRQTIQSADTIFFRMWNMQQTNYTMEIVPTNLNNGLTAYLIDNYLHTSQPLSLSDTTRIPFTVNSDVASSDPFRFKITFSAFKKLTALPFSYVSLGAVNQYNHVLIDWQTVNETNVENYQIERSADHVNYQPVATVNAENLTSNTYHWTDKNPLTESGFYRVRSVEMNGTSNYSDVVKVVSSKVVPGVSVYPNPVIGNTVNLKLSNQQPGIYKVLVYNSFGAVVLSHEFNCSAANAIVKLPVDKTISKGVYYLEIMNPFGKKQLMNIVF